MRSKMPISRYGFSNAIQGIMTFGLSANFQKYRLGIRRSMRIQNEYLIIQGMHNAPGQSLIMISRAGRRKDIFGQEWLGKMGTLRARKMPGFFANVCVSPSIRIAKR